MSKSHKSELGTKTYPFNICKQKGCKFYNKEAAQGVCHTNDPFVAGMSWDYVDKLEEAGEQYVKEIRKMFKKQEKKNHIEYLESIVAFNWIDSITSIDELIRLRRNNSLLKLENEKLKNGKTSKAKAGKV